MPPLPDPTFGYELRRLRLERGVSLRSFAGQVGVSPGFVSRVENGQGTPPSAETIVKMARVLSVDAFHLTFLAGKLPPVLRTLAPDLYRAARHTVYVADLEDGTFEDCERAVEGLREVLSRIEGEGSGQTERRDSAG